MAEVDGGFLLALTAGQEGDSRDSGGDGAAQGGDGGAGNLGGAGLVRAALPGHHHVGLQDRALKENVVVVQRLQTRD